MKGSDQTNNYANDSKVYTMLKIPAEPVSGPPEVVDQYQYAPQFSLKPQISGGDNHPNSSMVTNPSQGINSQLYNGKQLDRGMTLLQRSRIDLQEYIGSRNYASAIPDRTINFIKSILPISGGYY